MRISDWSSDVCSSDLLPLLIDQGDADEFLDGQLRPQLLQAAADAAGHPLQLRMPPGYDHSYYFIASFIGDHIAHHAAALAAPRASAAIRAAGAGATGRVAPAGVSSGREIGRAHV